MPQLHEESPASGMQALDTKKLVQQVISKKRVADHGEVFTAEREVNAMLDLVKQETERIDSRFLEPACGTGNFLVKVLERKLDVIEDRYRKNQLEFERYAVIGIASMYGIDILKDNVERCVARLFELFDERYTKLFKERCTAECRRTIRFILERNILHGDALTLKTVEGAGEPIVFSEWSAVNGSMIKRRDFTFEMLLQNQPVDGWNLFSDLGDQAFIPTPVREFPLTHFLHLADAHDQKS